VWPVQSWQWCQFRHIALSRRAKHCLQSPKDQIFLIRSFRYTSVAKQSLQLEFFVYQSFPCLVFMTFFENRCNRTRRSWRIIHCRVLC
jgi:hypothetical protein